MGSIKVSIHTHAVKRLLPLSPLDGTTDGYQRLARHLSANVADVYGLRKRGRLAPGMAADVSVIGPDGITDRAIYGAPQVQAAGVDMVIVNGVITWRNGKPLTSLFPRQLVS
jgi:N-acyl-D-aspartate/D-glutamate deacylase